MGSTSSSSAREIVEHPLGDRLPRIVILETMILRVRAVRGLAQGHSMISVGLELDSRPLNGQTNNFPTCDHAVLRVEFQISAEEEEWSLREAGLPDPPEIH